MNRSVPSVDEMLDDLHSAGWLTQDPRLFEGDLWSEEDLRSQWSLLQQRRAHEAIVRDPLAAG